jgi:hypothetical protein
MRALLAALILPALLHASARAQGDDIPSLRRDLAGLSLGDSLGRARRLYPPSEAWPATVERRTGVTRYRVEPGKAKAFPAHADMLYLGFKGRKLVEIELVYDEERSRVQTVEKTVGEYALIYGAEKRTADDRFWWSDGKTVLRVFNAELPVAGDGAHSVALRTAMQIFDRGLLDHEE